MAVPFFFCGLNERKDSPRILTFPPISGKTVRGSGRCQFAKASFPMKTLARFILGTWLGAALLAGCASTATDSCCEWADIKARSLLGSDGENCGTIQSHPLEPRTQQLRCVKLALAHRTPF